MKYTNEVINTTRYNKNTIGNGKLIENSELNTNNDNKRLFGSTLILTLMTNCGYYDVENADELNCTEHVNKMLEDASKRIGENMDDDVLRGRL